MRTCTTAFLAAVGGGLFVLALTNDGVWTQTPVNAQPLLGPQLERPSGPQSGSPTIVLPDVGLTPDEQVNVAVYEKTNRSVVNISTLSVGPDRWLLMPVPSEGSGSGSVLDKNGHVLTNNHVVDGAKQVVVTLFNGESFPAKLVGRDPVNDVAVIKIDAPAEQLVPISLGDSDLLKVGLRVFALGNPFGLDRTMSTGIIASLNRSLEVQENWVIKSVIQIDASINPGSSGGPLLDTRGRLIGMNTAIATGDSQTLRQSAGIGFAIPVNLIRRVVPELIQHGRVIRGDIGIRAVTPTEGGLRIARLDPGGPAERAGIRASRVQRQRQGPFVFERIDRNYGDVVTAINGKNVRTAAEFTGEIEQKKPGDVVELTILREGKTITVTVTLGGDSPVPQRAAPSNQSV
ncbi:MAG: trypsin-like peptidase domain-containing protein [Planctomycetaceae bacterium]|nr:trypsin-like peptidase domain-containing protein [Planctomycetaceae bacterium]